MSQKCPSQGAGKAGANGQKATICPNILVI